jgi:formylglycine-generating enzyme
MFHQRQISDRRDEPGRCAATAAEARASESMIWIPGGSFTMGSNKFYREERPERAVDVRGFWIDVCVVANADFARFVEATNYVTLAERAPDPAAYPDADPAFLVPGSSVFQTTAGPVDLRDYRAWWSYMPGADWRHPEGPESDISSRADHPVVHVAHEDACAYAAWIGKELPTEAEWEFAARGGLEGAIYAWGEEPQPDGRHMANTWQGRFPWENLGSDGWRGTSPVGAFPANAYGLFDMIGNVWEWTSSPFDASAQTQSCCGSANPRTRVETRVVKGGSHLCAPNYCFRYRPAARQSEPIDTATSHIGFRCIDRRRPPP